MNFKEASLSFSPCPSLHQAVCISDNGKSWANITWDKVVSDSLIPVTDANYQTCELRSMRYFCLKNLARAWGSGWVWLTLLWLQLRNLRRYSSISLNFVHPRELIFWSIERDDSDDVIALRFSTRMNFARWFQQKKSLHGLRIAGRNRKRMNNVNHVKDGWTLA